MPRKNFIYVECVWMRSRNIGRRGTIALQTDQQVVVRWYEYGARYADGLDLMLCTTEGFSKKFRIIPNPNQSNRATLATTRGAYKKSR